MNINNDVCVINKNNIREINLISKNSDDTFDLYLDVLDNNIHSIFKNAEELHISVASVGHPIEVYERYNREKNDQRGACECMEKEHLAMTTYNVIDKLLFMIKKTALVHKTLKRFRTTEDVFCPFIFNNIHDKFFMYADREREKSLPLRIMNEIDAILEMNKVSIEISEKLSIGHNDKSIEKYSDIHFVF